MDLARFARGITVDNPGQPTPAFVRFINRVVLPVVRVVHRPTLTGTEHLPVTGPFLLVANHSAGMGVSEIITFLALYLDQVGAKRPLAGFALPVSFRLFPLTVAMRAVGAVPSSYEGARDALAKGVPLLVFPGGNHETLRPLWQANRVDFGGHVGFLRIAHGHGIPVVPMGIRGAHFTAPMLVRSSRLAWVLVLPRLAGVKRWGISALGLMGALAILLAGPDALWLRVLLTWLWLASPLTFLPWIPWTVRIRVGRPLGTAELFPGGDVQDGALQKALTRVQAAVQALVDEPSSPR